MEGRGRGGSKKQTLLVNRRIYFVGVGKHRARPSILVADPEPKRRGAKYVIYVSAACRMLFPDEQAPKISCSSEHGGCPRLWQMDTHQSRVPSPAWFLFFTTVARAYTAPTASTPGPPR